MEREIFIRRRLSKTYNLQEDDFPNLRQFNDYLEHVEELVQRLLNNESFTEIEEEIRQFCDKNAAAIERNRKRLNADDLWIQQQIEEELAQGARRIQEQHADENIASGFDKKVLIDPKSIIKELRDSDLPAEILLDQKRKQQAEAEIESRREAEQKKLEKQEQRLQQRRLRAHGSDRLAFGVLRASGRPYNHQVIEAPLNGPLMPSDNEIFEKFAPHLPVSDAALAAGFTSLLACSRQLREARIDLFATL